VPKNEMDRRVQRTRRLIQDALIELILEKGYESVTIQDILDRADVGRSTFYAHYTDKDSLLLSRFEGLLAAFEEHAKEIAEINSANTTPPTNPVNLPLLILNYVEHEHRLFKALLGKNGGTSHIAYLQNLLLKYIRIILKNIMKAKLADWQLEGAAQYMTSAFLSLLVWWVDNDKPCSTEELYMLLFRLIEPGLKDVLEIPSLWLPSVQLPA
jgi:AcrR family transcriptional regulator